MILLLLCAAVVAGIVLLVTCGHIGTWLASSAVRNEHPVAVAVTVLGMAALGVVGAVFLILGLAGIVGPVG